MRYLWALIFALASLVAVMASCGGQTTSGTGATTGAGGHTNVGGTTNTTSGEGGSIFTFPDGGDDGPSCTSAVTCAKVGANCGPIGDGCGGILQCGDCTPPESCGGGGVPSQCGGTICTPLTCADQGIECGPAGNGCGGVLDCGSTCPVLGDTCGGGGVPGVCGHSSVCVPKTCVELGFNCGPAGDGCGGALDCGACTGGQSCGALQPGVCGTPPCNALTCAQLGFNCGAAGDGCGGVIQCGTCSSPQVCGGGGQPNVCGTSASCTNLCLQQVTCPTPGQTTTLKGTVYAPNGTDPLLNALVYVPNATVQPFPQGVTCDNCGAQASGSPLVSAVSGADGKFTINNVPVGNNIPVVIQLGRWRRQIKVNVTACTDNQIPAASTRLPKNKAEGDMPLMAFATGSLDALECVWRKIGIDDSEFTLPTDNGRVHLYVGNGGLWSGGASIGGGGVPVEDTLWSNLNTLKKYDMVLFPCQGAHYDKPSTAKQNLVAYANAGGRIFATHYSYVWLYNIAPFALTASWAPSASYIVQDPQTGYIDMTFPKGQALANWLKGINASTTLGQIQINTLRHDVNSVVAPTQTWMTIHNPQLPMHFTFNTPVGAQPANQCGRVLFDDFHVEDVFTYPQIPFPQECVGGPMTPQEKLLEFMLFDLASCVTPDVPICTPKTCAQLGFNCGPAGDGCGNLIQCGDCTPPATCGGGGTPSVCGAPQCTVKTCAQLGIQCGPAGDGCGGLLQCGTCPPGQTCGGGGQPGVCGTQTCTPKTCAQLNIQCGPAGDGCGDLIQCGSCPPGQTCGGGGTPGVCGGNTCTPKTCVQLGANCGPAADGCGGILQCGTCVPPQTCGGGGTPSVCGGSGPQ